MSLVHSILLGLVQGVAEFLPISSSGHLAIVEQILGVKGAAEVPGFFDVLLHLGTLAAVFVAYWPEIKISGQQKKPLRGANPKELF